MKILFWTGLFPPYIGGLETFGQELLHGLQRRGHDVLVVSLQGTPNMADFSPYLDIPVYRFDFPQALHDRNLRGIGVLLDRVRALKQTFSPDVIHVNDTGVGLFFHLNTPYPCPTICTVHDTFPRSMLQDTLRGRTLLDAARVVTVSQASYRMLAATAGEIEPRTSVLLNGLTMPALTPAPLPDDPPHFLCMARLVPEKGVDLALDAFANLRSGFPAIRLAIAGDGPCRAELEAQARRLHIEQAVHFLGWVAPVDIPALINTATAVLVPSRWQEPFGLVALEAAQMARPALVTAVGGLPEIVLDGETGRVVTAADSDALADAMRSILLDPGAAARMGVAARQRASDLFSAERMIDSYERLFTQVTHEASS